MVEKTLIDQIIPKLYERVRPFMEGEKTPWGYRPSFWFRALSPGISGNLYNGQGESKFRRAKRILWTRDDETPFGSVQRVFLIMSGLKGTVLYRQHLHTRHLARKEHEQMHAEPAKGGEKLSPEALTERIKAAARAAGADLVGITDFDPQWFFDGVEEPPWLRDETGKCTAKLVVVGVEMDYAHFSQAPELPAATEAMLQYDRGTEAALGAGEALLAAGYHAWSHAGPRAGRWLLIPGAVAAGLGTLGKHGSLITPEYGSSMRLGAVLTPAPLITDQPIDFGAESLCEKCQLCAKSCPVNAISHEKQWVRGRKKYYVDFDRCFPYFAEHNGCGICAAKCPYSHPRSREKLLKKHGSVKGN